MFQSLRLLSPSIGFQGLCILASILGIVHCCPQAAIRELYGKLTMLLLNGNVLHLNKSYMKIHEGGWQEYSQALIQSLTGGDCARFARTYRELILVHFSRNQAYLSQAGVPDVAGLVTPRFPDP